MTDKDSKKKILVTTSTLPRFQGDPEPRFVLDLCKALQEYYDVTILAPADPDARLEEILEGVRVVRYRYAPFRSQERLAYPGAILPRLKDHPTYWLLVPLLLRGLYAATRSLLNAEEFACVHCHWLLPQGIIHSLFFSGRAYPPYIVTSHGGDVYSLNNGIFQRIYNRVIGNAGAVTVVSCAVMEYIEDNLSLPSSDKELRVISMGVDLNRFHPRYRVDDWPETHGLTRPIMLFVGRLAEKKGLIYLLQAMAMEPLRATSASLAIIGEGPLREELESGARRLGISEKVKFFGSMNHEQLGTVHASCDFFCAPSIVAKGGDAEGLPTVLCEAAASGLPSVATTVGGIPEVVLEGETGILVAEQDPAALAEACHRYVTDPQLRLRAGDAARRHITRFGWENIGKQYAEVIEETVRQRLQRKLKVA